jgi:hypothetical protein
MKPNNKPVTINNLTQRQVELLDHMWELETMEEVEQWMLSLSARDQLISQSLMQMVMHEMVEELMVEDLSLTNDYLKRFRLQ